MSALVGSAVRVVLLTGLWLLAWGDATPGKIATGLVLAVVVLAAFPAERRSVERLRVRVGALVRLLGYILTQLVTSNVLVAREIVTRGTNVTTGVLAHPLDDASDEVMSLVANIIALTPGTMTVELTKDPNVLYVHFLLLDDVEAARESIAHLEHLVTRAIYRAPARPGAANDPTPTVPTDPSPTPEDPS